MTQYITFLRRPAPVGLTVESWTWTLRQKHRRYLPIGPQPEKHSGALRRLRVLQVT